MAELTNTAELLDLIHRDRAELEACLARVPADKLTAPVLAGGWSVKDMLAHIIFWEQRALLILANARAGQKTPLSWESEEDIEQAINRVNEAARQASQAQSLEDVLVRFAASYQEMLTTIEATPEDYLFISDDFWDVAGGNVVELIASNTYEHYPEHAAMLAAWLGA